MATRDDIAWTIATIIADSGNYDLGHIDVADGAIIAWREYGGVDEPTNVVAFSIVIA